MFLTNLFNLKRACQHENVAPNLEKAYCPDCGKLIENKWYIARCACCGVKLKACIHNGNIVPQSHYCTNCGSKEYQVENIAQINFIDINFAVLKKVEVEPEFIPNTIRCWQEKSSGKPKLLVQYL